MSDVLVGGIEAKLTVDTTQFESGMERSGEQMKGLYTRINTLPPAIQKLQQQEEKLSRAMEEQIRKVAEMDAALTAAADQYSALEKAMGRTGDIDLDKVFARETAELKKADAQLDEYRRKLEQVDAQKQEAMEKYNASRYQKRRNARIQEQLLSHRQCSQFPAGSFSCVRGQRCRNREPGRADGVSQAVFVGGGLRRGIYRGYHRLRYLRWHWYCCVGYWHGHI